MKEDRGGLIAIVVFLLAGLFVGLPATDSAPSKDSASNQERPDKASANASGCLQSSAGAMLDIAALSDGIPIEDLKAFMQGSMYPVEFLIATVPDPLDSTVGWRFDERVAAIKQAVEETSHVFDQFWLPWQCGRDGRPGLGREHRDRPGVLVFRGTYHVLIVFLVGEAPTWGVHKAAMRDALDLVARWRAVEIDCEEWKKLCTTSQDPFRLLECRACPSLNRTVRIVGPTFSGSMTSIRRVLQGWVSTERDRIESDRTERSHCGDDSLSVEIISGSATNQSLDALLRMTTQPEFRAAVRLRSTILPDSALLEGFVRFLTDVLDDDAPRVAILTESGTAYGQLLRQHLEQAEGTASAAFRDWRILPFPLHISQLRHVAEQPEQRNEVEETLSLKKSLTTVPLGAFGDPRDVLPAIEPKMSGAAAELALANILSTIARDEFSHVGIFATDVRDKLFLAQEVKKFVPGATLFAFESDLLYAHPSFRRATEGMLVVSTYPLFAPNQRWTNSGPRFQRGAERLLQMSSDGAQGTYNATLVQLNEMHEDLSHVIQREDPPRLLEYSSPFESSTHPPVWISAVGRGGVWPIWSAHVDGLPGYLHHSAAPVVIDRGALFRAGDHLGSAWWIFTILVGAALSLIVVCIVTAMDMAPNWLGSCSWFRVRACPICARRQGVYLVTLLVLLAASAVLFYRPYPRFIGPSAWAFLLVVLGVIVAAPLVYGGYLVFGSPDRPGEGSERCVHGERRAWRGLDALGPEARRRFTTAGVVALLGGYSVFIGFLLVSEMARLSTAEQYFLLYRAGHLASGLSPLAPVAFVTGGAVWWCLLNLYRFDLIERAVPESPEREATPTGDLLNSLRAGLASVFRCAPPLQIAGVLFVGWLLPFLFMWDDLRTVLEGPFLGRSVVWMIVFGYGAILAVSLAHLLFLWRRVAHFLRYLEAGWTREAFARVAKKLPGSALRGLWATPFTVSSLDNFVRVAEAAEPPPARVRVNVPPVSELRSGIDKAVGSLKADLRRGENESRDWASFAKTDTQEALTQAAAGAARTLEALGAGDGLTPRIDGKPLGAGLAEWADGMRDLLASQYLAVLAPVLIYMRHLSSFLVGASLLFLLAVTSYPVQPTNLLHLHGILWLVLAIVVATTIAFRIKQNDVMGQLATKGEGGAGWLDLRAVGTVLTYVILPLLGLFATQSPEFGKMLDQVLRIFG